MDGVGTVHGKPGDWVGIDWDDAFRGKHDGIIDGVRYFQSSQPTSGSFLPIEKFKKEDLCTALRSRYVSNGEQEYDDDLFFPTVSQGNKKIELVGMNKIGKRQQHTQNLRSADLSGSCIAYISSCDVTSEMLANLVELNLSFNLITDWNVILDLLKSLPKLAILNLSGNAFLRSQKEQGESVGDKPPVSLGLKTLILNECGIDWKQVVWTANWLPRLTEIQVLRNDLTSLSAVSNTLDCLEVVDLSFNKLADWDEVCRLGQLRNLKKINLTSNPLTSVSFKNADPFFVSLESLLLGDCAITSWDSVDALHYFPKLRETRLTGNPLLQNFMRGGRFEIVARVGGLTQLNGSKVSRQERIDCERRYVSYVGNYLHQNHEEGSTVHPRYTELVAKHGEPSISVSAVKQTGALKESIMDVSLVCLAPSAGSKMGSQKKKVSPNMTLGSLKTLVEKLFGITKTDMKLFLKFEEHSIPEDITDVKDDKRLGDLYIMVHLLIQFSETQWSVYPGWAGDSDK